MDVLVQHWSYDPFLPVALVVVVIHERGLRRLNHRSGGVRARKRRLRSLWFYLGVAVLLVAVESPIDYWSDRYFWVHMIQHLLLIFAAPAPIVAGAPWLPLEHGIPASIRRPVSRALLLGGWSAPLRRLSAWARSPWAAVVGLNVVVVFWHMPGPFDLAERDLMVHVWLMHGSFFAFGVLFWLQMIPSHPATTSLSPPAQMASIFATATIFWLLAMALSIFSSGSWYEWYRVHEGHALSPFADQQIGAGIMWTCGIFWAVPAMVVATRRLIEQRGDEGIESAIDAMVKGRRRVRSQGRVHAEVALREARRDPVRPAAGAGAGRES